jgi:hypothetical protein
MTTEKNGSAGEAEAVFPIQKITNHRVVERKKGLWQTEFKVRWKGWKARDDTWEPLEHLTGCPMLLLDYIMKKGEQFTKPYKVAGGPLPKGRIPPPRNKVVIEYFARAKDLWYIPEGFEFVKAILKEVSVSGNVYMAVVFRHLKPGVVHVPRCLMDYYFPTEVALFLGK